MNERYDVHGTGTEDGGGTAPDVRGLLDNASWTGQHEPVDPHEHWASGRRRRSRKRAGAGLLGGVAVVAVAGLVWQAGVFGGEAGPLEPHVATLPSGLTTFVLAASDGEAGGVEGAGGVEEDGAELQVADAEDLSGTSWGLTDQVWGSDQSATEIVGSDAETVFSFGGAAGRGWGFGADDCGGGWFQEDLQLTADGSFAGGDLATRDVGCPDPAQTAEDFWIDVLVHGGTLHTLDHDWLLLSVDTEQAGVEQPPPVVVEDATRLVFVRDGTDPDGADPDGADLDAGDPVGVDLTWPERVPSNEDLAGTRWRLAGAGTGADGAEILAPWLEEPSRLRLWFAEGYPGSLGLVYGDGCVLAQLRTEGVDARGATVPIEGLSSLVEEGDGTCSGAEAAGPVLTDALESGAQVTLVGDDTLLLRIVLPADDGVAPTQTPAAPTNPDDDEAGTPAAGESPTPSTATRPVAAPTGPTAAPTTPSTPTDATSPTDPTAPAEITAPDAGPAFMDPDEQWIGQPWPASGGGLYAPSVRAGVHDGFDRIVLDLTGEPGATGPGWYAVYTPNPLRDGSGLPMEIAGDSVLEIVLNGMAYPEPGDPVYDDGDFGLDTHRLGAVEEVIRTTPWEGQIQLFIGMQGEPRPYRVFLIQDRMRLVVDVQTS